MEKDYIRSVIILIGGAELPGESMKQYLARVSLYTGIGYSSIRAAYYGQDIGPGVYISKNTRQKLEQAAQHVQRPRELIAYTERHLAIWEGNPAQYRPWIDAARSFLDELRGYDETPSRAVSVARPDDGGGGRGGLGATAEAAEAGLAAAAGAAKT